jgi:hypothetical protein
MLVQVVSDFATELNSIEGIFRSTPETRVACHPLDYCAITDGCIGDIWDAWVRFMRRLYVTCAGGQVWSTSNVSYHPATPLAEIDVLSRLREAGAARGSGVAVFANEPRWFVVTSVVPICAILGLSNATAILNSLGSSTVTLGGGFSLTNPLDEIRQIRNYCAHKTEDMANLVSSRYTSGLTVSAYVRQVTRGGSTRFHDWCEALEAIAWDAAL